MVKMEKETVEIMKKHLRLFNKNVRDDVIISGIAKMKKDQVQKIFDKLFNSGGSGDNKYYALGGSGSNYNIPADRFDKMVKDSMKIMRGEKTPKKEKEEPKKKIIKVKKEEKKPDPPKKKFKIKRKDKK